MENIIYMNANAIRHFYDYHFTINGKVWDQCVSHLSLEQFSEDVNYSHGSVRDQILHLISVDDAWFSDLSGSAFIDEPDSAENPNYGTIRAYWDKVEEKMRHYLAALDDVKLSTKPLEGEDKDLLLWQVLLHVVNHGTDHRAQILRLMNDLGVETSWQDYIFFCYGRPVE